MSPEQPGLWGRLREAPGWIHVLLVVGAIVAIAGLASGDGGGGGKHRPSYLPAGAVAGKLDGECEAGPVNQCNDAAAARQMKAPEVWCRWEGRDVIVHVLLHNAFGAGADVSVIPRYVIANGGQHGTSFGSQEHKKVRAYSDVVFNINAGHPEGVPNDSPIEECKPKLFNVDLANVP